MARDVTEKLIRNVHPEKVLGYLPGLSDESVAALYGLSKDDYLRVRSALAAQVGTAAQALLKDPEIASAIDALPLGTGGKLLAVGESTTADRLSWLEILRELIALRRPHAGIDVVNAGVAGDTTTHALARLPAALAHHQPTWVVLFLGGNDMMRFGGASGKTLVSLEESAHNLAEMRRISSLRDGVGVMMVTPLLVDEQRVADFPPFKAGGISLRNEDLTKMVDVVHAQHHRIVDVHSCLGDPPRHDLVQLDGVHPTIQGHCEIVTTFLESVAT